MLLFDHQISGVPLVLEALNRHGGALLCDPPGTGKSLIACEAAARSGAVRVNVIAPLHLAPAWRKLLDDRGLRHAGVLTHDAALPSLKSDLLIIDEAHRLRNPSTRRYRSIAAACVGARVLLVTATPIVKQAGDLVALLNLFVADDHFAVEGLPSIGRAAQSEDLRELLRASSPLVIRRTFLTRELQLPVAVERKIIFQLDPAADEIREALSEMTFPGSLAGGVTLREMLWRRYLSSPAALQGSLQRQLRYLRRLEDRRDTGWSLQRRGRESEDAGGEQSALFPQVFGAPTSSKEDKRVGEEIRRCEMMLEVLGRQLTDPKLEMLERHLQSRKAALVFTESAETAAYLWSRMSSRAVLVTSRRGRLSSGATCSPGEAVEAFRSGSADLMISTDVASEGLNLERAGCVVHYDLAWVPVRLEQRVGRAARLGSGHRRVESVLLVPREGSDSRIERLNARSRLAALLDSRVSSGSRTRCVAIPYLPADAPHARLARLLRECGEEDRVLAGMLGSRYVAGVELALSELAARGRIPLRLIRRTLLRLIETQRATSKSDEPSSKSVDVQSRKLPFVSP